MKTPDAGRAGFVWFCSCFDGGKAPEILLAICLFAFMRKMNISGIGFIIPLQDCMII